MINYYYQLKSDHYNLMKKTLTKCFTLINNIMVIYKLQYMKSYVFKKKKKIQKKNLNKKSINFVKVIFIKKYII